MKKLLVLTMALIMALSITACGDNSETTPEPQSSQSQSAAEVPSDQVEAEQKKANADYEQLTLFIADIEKHQVLLDAYGVLAAQLKAGTATEADALDALMELADDSGRMITAIEEATWQTEYYSKHVEALTASVSSLAAAEELSYQASAENNSAKLEQAEPFIVTYHEQLDILLTLLGV